MTMRIAPGLLLLSLLACGSSSDRAVEENAVAAPRASQQQDAAPPVPHLCPIEIDRREVAPGLIYDRLRASIDPPAAGGDRWLRIVRVDPTRYQLRLLTAKAHGGSRTAAGWAEEFELSGVINASMFRPSLRSTGLMVDGDEVNNGGDTKKFGAFFAFDPRTAGAPPVTMVGRDCSGFDLEKLRADYRVVVQNYRLLDCDGAAIAWQDEKIYSAAAVGVDADGRVVFIHVRTPYLMRDLTRMLAAPELAIAQAMFVEGGPEASLYVKVDKLTLEEVGSYETGFNETDDNQRSWPIPNVIGFAPRDR